MNVVVSLAAGAPGYKEADVTIIHDGNNDNIEFLATGTKVAGGETPVQFTTSKVNGLSIDGGTALQFGPDGKLYVTEMNGVIKIYDVVRNGKNNYSAVQSGVINSITQTPNHNDNGDPVNLGAMRLVTGIYVTGSAAAPIIYVASSDPRQAAGPSGLDANLDTNSGILHKLTKSGGGWIKTDLIRGLPRSEEKLFAEKLKKQEALKNTRSARLSLKSILVA